MGINIFYKVRAERNNQGEISISEKGLLRFLRTPESRKTLREDAQKYLANHPENSSIYSIYVWDATEGNQIAHFDRITAQKIGLS